MKAERKNTIFPHTLQQYKTLAHLPQCLLTLRGIINAQLTTYILQCLIYCKSSSIDSIDDIDNTSILLITWAVYQVDSRWRASIWIVHGICLGCIAVQYVLEVLLKPRVVLRVGQIFWVYIIFKILQRTNKRFCYLLTNLWNRSTFVMYKIH